MGHRAGPPVSLCCFMSHLIGILLYLVVITRPYERARGEAGVGREAESTSSGPSWPLSGSQR